MEEWTNKFNQVKVPDFELQNVQVQNFKDLPDEIDWRDEGGFNPIQDQKPEQCQSGGAFSAIFAAEHTHWINTGELLKLSEQSMIDCNTIGWGCVDLDPPQRYWSYIAAAHGIVLEEFDKYTATNSTYNCVRNKTLMANVTTTVWTNSIIGSVNSVKQLMIGATVAMGIDASSILFKQYQGGILNDVSCGTKVNHYVNGVGYGTDEEGKSYFILRNSFGTEWGEDGYMRIALGQDGNGMCGILTYPAQSVI